MKAKVLSMKYPKEVKFKYTNIMKFQLIKIFLFLCFVYCSFICFAQQNRIYDKESNEFYVYNTKVSKGAGAFINTLLQDQCWVLKGKVIEDDWYKNQFLSYETVHWCVFEFDTTVSRNKAYQINLKLFGNVFNNCGIDPLRTEIKINWLQSGQIQSIEISNFDIYQPENLVRVENSIFDSIFPMKRIGNKMCGYFTFFGIKNVSVYVSGLGVDYEFEEVYNEKYKYTPNDIRDILLPQFKDDTSSLFIVDTTLSIQD